MFDIKKTALLLLLFVSLGFSSINSCYSLDSQNTLGNKIMLTGADSVAAKANANSSINTSGCSIMQDPVMGGMMSGYYNMMQNMNGGSYNPQELQKQQSDYAKQQINNQ